MPYAGYCQGCVNEEGIGRACGQNPLSYCNKHLLDMYESTKEWRTGIFPSGTVTEDQVSEILTQYEEEIRSRGLLAQ